MPDYALRLNNVRDRQICPACGATFKPEIGPWPFLPDTWQALCEDCATGSDLTSPADRVEQAAFTARLVRLATSGWGRPGATTAPADAGDKA